MKYSIRVFISIIVFCLSTQSVNAIEFPVVQGKGVLTVVGEGYGHRDILEDGEQPSLSAYGSSGDPLPDGFYRYEFRSFPEGTDSSPRQQSYQQPEGKAVGYGKRKSKGEGVSTVSGRFEIQGGELIFP
jgi:hypothetical protein